MSAASYNRGSRLVVDQIRTRPRNDALALIAQQADRIEALEAALKTSEHDLGRARRLISVLRNTTGRLKAERMTQWERSKEVERKFIARESFHHAYGAQCMATAILGDGFATPEGR